MNKANGLRGLAADAVLRFVAFERRHNGERERQDRPGVRRLRQGYQAPF